MFCLQEEGLEDVRQMLAVEHQNAHRRLRGVLNESGSAIANYIRLSANLNVGAGAGKTKLDNFRLEMCKKHMV